MTDRTVTTYSLWSLFRNCRKAAYWRYLREIVPAETDGALALGSVVHQALERWHTTRDLAATLDLIDRAYPNRAGDESEKRDWHLATAMLRGYARRYPAETFEAVALEKTFEGEIVNPATGRRSRSFVLRGKVDGIVRQPNGEVFVLEHKTAAAIDGTYLDRLWTDFQITIYAHYVEQALGLKVAGVLYNVLAKARLQQSKGETEAEFEARRAELAAKSKTGTSRATRREAESDEDFAARLDAWYDRPEAFHREVLYLSRDRFQQLRAELWELTQALLDARRRGAFYQNTSYCFHHHRPCPFYALCRSNDSPVVLENLYRHAPAHAELEDEPAEAATPAF